MTSLVATPLPGRSAYPRLATFSRTLRAAMRASTCLQHPILNS
jgi:hypothetical protein